MPRTDRHFAACCNVMPPYNPPLLLTGPENHSMAAKPAKKPVAIIMGSQSDWETMQHAAATLDALKIGYESQIVSAHRTPDRLYAFGKSARKKGFKVVIAGAGGAAHLPGMTASLTSLPVFGV